MNNWQYAGDTPSLPGRGEMTLARRIYLRQEAGGAYVLVQEPVLPKVAAGSSGALTLEEANRRFGGKEPGDSVYLLRATLEPGAAAEIGVRLRRSSLQPDQPAEQETVIGIDRARGEIFVDRRKSGYVSFSPDFPARDGGSVEASWGERNTGRDCGRSQLGGGVCGGWGNGVDELDFSVRQQPGAGVLRSSGGGNGRGGAGSRFGCSRAALGSKDEMQGSLPPFRMAGVCGRLSHLGPAWFG